MAAHMPNFGVGQDPLDLAKNLQPSSLKTLKILNISPNLYTPADDPYLSLAPQLEQFAGRNVLEGLKFHIWVDSDTRCNTDPANWEKLDNILSQSGAFPFLRSVEIVVLQADNASYKALEEDLLDIGRNHFPLLKARGGLAFLFEVRKGNMTAN